MDSPRPTAPPLDRAAHVEAARRELDARIDAELAGIWSAHDEALFTTYEIAGYLGHGRTPPAIAPTFRMSGNQDEVLVAAGTYKRRWFGTGDQPKQSGKWTPVPVKVFRATQGFDSRRERWRSLDAGEVFVSTQCFYLRTATGAAPLIFNFNAVNEATIVAPRTIEASVTVEGGVAYRYQIVSDWAELIFLLWAGTCAPQHPQFLDWSQWIPQGWHQRARTSGRADSSIVKDLFDQK